LKFVFSEFIEQVIHIPCKHQKERLRLLREFTKDMRMCEDVRVEDIVRRLNGHVVQALKCVCQRAASIAVLNGMDCVKNVCFDKAIQYVSVRG
jgi:ATP-dependent 26S proteasome regulatory subunit